MTTSVLLDNGTVAQLIDANSSTKEHHTTNSSTSGVVGGTSATSAGGYTVSLDPETWTTTDRVVVDNIYHPAVPPVYGEPYLGCGYAFCGNRAPSGGYTYMTATYDLHISARCPGGYETERITSGGNVYTRYDAACTGGSGVTCPYGTFYDRGRPFRTTITPGQDAWNEPVYENVTTTHYRDTFGARSNDHFSQSSYCGNQIRHSIRD